MRERERRKISQPFDHLHTSISKQRERERERELYLYNVFHKTWKPRSNHLIFSLSLRRVRRPLPFLPEPPCESKTYHATSSKGLNVNVPKILAESIFSVGMIDWEAMMMMIIRNLSFFWIWIYIYIFMRILKFEAKIWSSLCWPSFFHFGDFGMISFMIDMKDY